MRLRVISSSVAHRARQTDQGLDVGVVGNDLAALRLRDSRQTRAHLIQLTLYPIINRV